VNKNIFFVEKYLEFLTAKKNLAQNTCISYKSDLDSFIKYFGDKSIVELGNNEINSYIKFLSKRFSPKTHLRKLSSIKSFFNFLIDRKVLSSNILEDYEFPKLDKKLPKVLSERQIEKLINKTYDDKSHNGMRSSLFLEILYSTGIRVSELVTLKLGSIGYDNTFLVIQGKGKKERIVPLISKTKHILKKYLKIRNFFLAKGSKENNFLFPSSSKLGHITRNRFFQILKKLAINANISPSEVSPHTLRHSFASHLLQRGVDLRTIQESLGHKDISTTQIYTHVQASKFRKILEEKHPLKKDISKFLKI